MPSSSANQTSFAQARGRTLFWLLGSVIAFAVYIYFNAKSFDLVGSGGACSLRETEHGNLGEEYMYELLVRLATGGPAQHSVALVTLTPDTEPLSVLTNTCDSRVFFTALVPRLVSLGASVIAIDKFYSQGACGNREVNQAFRAAINRAPVPVVVGQAVHRAPGAGDDAAEGCLAVTPHFDFGTAATPALSGVSNVKFGLTRLNENSMQIPLAWPALDTGAKEPTSHVGFALAVAGAARPTLSNDSYLGPYLNGTETGIQHPFSYVSEHDLPQWSALNVLCYNTPTDTLAPFGQKCTTEERTSRPELSHRIVLVGEHVDSDLQPYPGKDRFGVDLQANYVDALLSNDFVRELPRVWDWALAGTFFVLAGCVELVFGDVGEQRQLAIRKVFPKSFSNELHILLADTLLLFLSFLAVVLVAFAHLYAPISVLALYPLSIALALRWALFVVVRLFAHSSPNKELL